MVNDTKYCCEPILRPSLCREEAPKIAPRSRRGCDEHDAMEPRGYRFIISNYQGNPWSIHGLGPETLSVLSLDVCTVHIRLGGSIQRETLFLSRIRYNTCVKINYVCVFAMCRPTFYTMTRANFLMIHGLNVSSIGLSTFYRSGRRHGSIFDEFLFVMNVSMFDADLDFPHTRVADRL